MSMELFDLDGKKVGMHYRQSSTSGFEGDFWIFDMPDGSKAKVVFDEMGRIIQNEDNGFAIYETFRRLGTIDSSEIQKIQIAAMSEKELHEMVELGYSKNMAIVSSPLWDRDHVENLREEILTSMSDGNDWMFLIWEYWDGRMMRGIPLTRNGAK